jgi:hypothetical protein
MKSDREVGMNQPRTVYICGPMSIVGPPTWNFDAFDKAEDLLDLQGFVVYNPAEMDRQEEGWKGPYPPEGFVPTKADKMRFMRRDLDAIEKCTHLYVLKGWETSPGGAVEIAYAKFLGLEILYE